VESPSLSRFVCRPDPGHPGWLAWDLLDKDRFNPQVMGKLLVRTEDSTFCHLRMFTETRHSNVQGNVHGGVTLALIDIALFATVNTMLAGDADGSVTLEVTNQFIGSGVCGKPMDAITEVLRETRRLVFLRGLVRQGEELIASYTGTVRKPSSPR
jgi:uncharacterized protein (TIGR00369 family)